jgi:hypothetical protein
MGGVFQGAQCVMVMMTVETVVMKQSVEAVSLKVFVYVFLIIAWYSSRAGYGE